MHRIHRYVPISPITLCILYNINVHFILCYVFDGVVLFVFLFVFCVVRRYFVFVSTSASQPPPWSWKNLSGILWDYPTSPTKDMGVAIGHYNCSSIYFAEPEVKLFLFITRALITGVVFCQVDNCKLTSYVIMMKTVLWLSLNLASCLTLRNVCLDFLRQYCELRQLKSSLIPEFVQIQLPCSYRYSSSPAIINAFIKVKMSNFF